MNKKIFISYSWGTKEHQDWVLNLAKRLMSDGVDVILDKWDLKEGHDVFEFMESMVKSDEISKVLMICDKEYQKKANNRDGGVGTETQIITPEIYSNQKQEKFIPIVVQRDDKGGAILPIYLSSRKYIDLSSEEYFEESYEELLRNILEAPALRKPKLGKIPSYITESSLTDNQTNFILRTLDNQLNKSPNRINSISREFIDTFLENLWNYEFKCTSHDLEVFGDELINNLHSYKELREDYIQFLLKVTQSEYDLDIDILINFFEQAPQYKRPKESERGVSYSSTNYINFDIIVHELFIYTVSICYKNSNFNLLGDLLHSGYYFNEIYEKNTDSKRYSELYSYHRNLEDYYKKKYNKITGFGDFAITNLSDKINKMDFILADTICHYVSELQEYDAYSGWFPATHLYKFDNQFDFFKKLASKRHFEKVKSIFNVNDSNELKNNLIKYKEKTERDNRRRVGYGSGGFHGYIPFVFEVIDIEKIVIER